jgi:hypothetical protein
MFDVRGALMGLMLSTIAVAGLSTASRAETGTLRVEVVKAGLILGVGGGNGIMIYKGRRYPFTVSGLSIGATIGASKTDLIGRAYNLRQPSDLAGTYSAIGGGVAVAGGGGGVRLQNANGVVIELQGRKVGLEFSASVSGATIAMR